MKNAARIGFWMILVALALTACATTKVENIARTTQPIGKIETLMVKVESVFTPSKEGTRLKETVVDELQKNGIKVEQISNIALNVEIEDFQIPSSASR